MFSLLKFGGSRLSATALALSLAIAVASGSTAHAHGGGGGGGHGGGGGGHGGGGGGRGGFGGGGYGGGGYRGGYGGGGYQGGYGGYGGFYGGLGLGYGLGYGYGGYGGYGYGYPAYGYGYPAYGYSDPAYGYGYTQPYVNGGYVDPQYQATYPTIYTMPATQAVGTTATATVGQRRYLGIDETPVVDTNGTRGMKVATVYAGTPAEKSGLQIGDVIHSVNGYLTENPGNLAWIIANATPNNVLQMNVHSAAGGPVHVIAANLP